MAQLNYFVEGHGKNYRDSHFGAVARFLGEQTRDKSYHKIENVVKLLNMMPNTVALYYKPVRTRYQKLQLEMKNFTSTYCIRKLPNGNLECAFLSDIATGFEFVPTIKSSRAIFLPKMLTPVDKNKAPAGDIFSGVLVRRFERRVKLKEWLKENTPES